MTRFSLGVQLVCLGALGSLLVYTLALVRVGRLTARVTVSWILADLIAIAAILLWGRLPVIAYTSALGDRELLLVLAVLFFSYVAYLMLDSLQRISAQSAQIARLAQQMALLQESLTAAPRRESQDVPPRPTTTTTPGPASQGDRSITPPREAGPLAQLLLAAWLIICFGTYVIQEYSHLPFWLHTLLLAGYKE
jgi:hypothetical protein